jgi:hypothetical protein
VVAGDTGRSKDARAADLGPSGLQHPSPRVAVTATQEGAKTNTVYNPQVASAIQFRDQPGDAIPLKFHPGLPTQNLNSVWTFNGTIPPKLVIGRYGEPLLFRHPNKLPFDREAERLRPPHDQHARAQRPPRRGERRLHRRVLLPGPVLRLPLADRAGGFRTINTAATDPKAATPEDSGGKINIPGDWRETMSTHWFHDHMFSFTSQNVYKGNAAMFNIYSALDRGNEAINDGVNLRLPSGTAKSFGNLEYDVNLMLAEKAWDAQGQLAMDIFDFDGFLGDRMTVNLTYKPVLRGRAAQVPLPHPERERVALLQARALRRLDDDPDRERRQPAAEPGAAHPARRAGHRGALRHRHRLLALQPRPERFGW